MLRGAVYTVIKLEIEFDITFSNEAEASRTCVCSGARLLQQMIHFSSSISSPFQLKINMNLSLSLSRTLSHTLSLPCALLGMGTAAARVFHFYVPYKSTLWLCTIILFLVLVRSVQTRDETNPKEPSIEHRVALPVTRPSGMASGLLIRYNAYVRAEVGTAASVRAWHLLALLSGVVQPTSALVRRYLLAHLKRVFMLLDLHAGGLFTSLYTPSLMPQTQAQLAMSCSAVAPQLSVQPPSASNSAHPSRCVSPDQMSSQAAISIGGEPSTSVFSTSGECSMPSAASAPPLSPPPSLPPRSPSPGSGANASSARRNILSTYSADEARLINLTLKVSQLAKRKARCTQIYSEPSPALLPRRDESQSLECVSPEGCSRPEQTSSMTDADDLLKVLICLRSTRLIDGPNWSRNRSRAMILV